jgi:SAM-dependent methyltransferase
MHPTDTGLLANSFDSDNSFHQLYPVSSQLVARKHWTPLKIANKAAGFLASEKNSKILDIGSGIGKFCLSAAYYYPHSFFYGIEQREDLVQQAEKAREVLGLFNTGFIHGNFTKIDFRKYDHFYFYNSFYENLEGAVKLDNNLPFSEELFRHYNCYLNRQLERMPEGTRLATYHSEEDIIPESFKVVGTDIESRLKYWIKII